MFVGPANPYSAQFERASKQLHEAQGRLALVTAAETSRNWFYMHGRSVHATYHVRG